MVWATRTCLEREAGELLWRSRGQGSMLPLWRAQLQSHMLHGAAKTIIRRNRIHGQDKASESWSQCAEIVQSHSRESDLWFWERFSLEGCTAKNILIF